MDGVSRMMDALILSGALEVSALDSETGEFVYSITEKMEEIYPELYEEVNNEIYKSIMSLWQKGFILMDIASRRPQIAPSSVGIDRSTWGILSVAEYNVMNTVLRMYNGEV
jgi:hypothetical protein